MDPVLRSQLERARALGFLGPGDVQEHVTHASGFVTALSGVTGRVVELGSGGGVPGLVVAMARPDLELVLVEAMAKRGAFLESARGALGLPQVRVLVRRAEVVGREDLRGTADAVIARGFGPPAVTAECAAPLLRLGGRLIVSEPPDAADRWSVDGLEMLGLQVGPRAVGPPAIQILVQVAICPDQFPRRDGRPAKRPLF